MKILHAYCLNYNIGDYYLGIGVKNLLRQYLDVDLIAETNIQGTIFSEYFIDEVVNKKYDLLVIGGGGIIHGAHWPNGWFWLIKEELIKNINIPFIVYGVGYNYFKNEGEVPAIGRAHLRETIKHAKYFSIRNDGSVERFKEQMNIAVPETPDPGFHVNLNKTYECSEKKPYILIQLANDKPEDRFDNIENKRSFVHEMRNVAKYLSESYKIIFSPHVYDDISISNEVAKGINNTKVWDFSKYAFDNCAESIGFYQNAEFILAMRGHGQIVPIAFNTPVISLENHPKHSGLMNKLGLREYNISVKEDNFSSKLLDLTTYITSNRPAYLEKLIETNKQISAASQKTFNDINESLKE